MRRAIVAAIALIAVAVPARAQILEPECEPYSAGSPHPGGCGYADHGEEFLANPFPSDVTFSVRFNIDRFVVLDDRDQSVVSGTAHDAFLSKLTASWERVPFLSIPDPSDAGRAPQNRTGGIDGTLAPVRQETCGPRPVLAQATNDQACRIGRVHPSGSRSLLGDRTDIRYFRVVFRLDASADPNHYLAAYVLHAIWAPPPPQDCPTGTVNGVCSAPVYQR